MSRQGHELIDNAYPLQVLPDTNIQKYDAGLQSVEYHTYIPKEPANFGYQQTSSIVSFVVDAQGLENVKDAKLYGKVKLGGAGVSTAVFDGGAQAMFSESKLETKDNTAIEHLKRNNRVMQSLKLNCSGVVNLKQI